MKYTAEETSERYGDCCEVNYELIEKDKQKALKTQAEEIVKELRLLISAYDENNCDEALEGVKIYLKQLEETE